MHFGALSAEMLRACRLVVDTGHPRDGLDARAVDPLPRRTTPACTQTSPPPRSTATSSGRARRWATRSASSRSRSCARRREGALGDKFDVRRFHNAVLDDGAAAAHRARSAHRRMDQRQRTGKPNHEETLIAAHRRSPLARAGARAAGLLQGRDQDRRSSPTPTYMLTGAGGNLGLSVGDDAVFLIDDQFAPLTRRSLAAIAKITPKPVKLRAQHALALRPHRRQRELRQGGRDRSSRTTTCASA